VRTTSVSWLRVSLGILVEIVKTKRFSVGVDDRLGRSGVAAL
jgi:hypothetical protein